MMKAMYLHWLFTIYTPGDKYEPFIYIRLMQAEHLAT